MTLSTAQAEQSAIGAGLVARYAGMTDGTIVSRPSWDVFDGDAEVGYIMELTYANGTTFDWHVEGDAGWSDYLPEALVAMRAAMVELAEEQADIAARKAEIEALPEPARLAEQAAQRAEIRHLVATHRNTIDPEEVSATRAEWDRCRAVALTERLKGSLEQIDAERAA